MKHCFLSVMLLLSTTLASQGGEGPTVPPINTGTPRVLSPEESVKIEAFLRAEYKQTAVAFGEQMGFGGRRMEPLVYFHFLADDHYEWMQIELMGVVNHADPVVFKNPLPTAKGAEVLRNESFEDAPKKVTPPAKGQFGKAEVRPLLPAEQQALKSMNAGADFYWEQTGNELRAVGALRAAKSCAECHEVKEGALLGALTYRWSTQVVLDAIKEQEAEAAKDKARRKK